MIRDHFSLHAWHPFGDSQFWLIRVDADWCRAQYLTISMIGGPSQRRTAPGWFAVTVGLFGFCACITYWPRGKN